MRASLRITTTVIFWTDLLALPLAEQKSPLEALGFTTENKGGVLYVKKIGQKQAYRLVAGAKILQKLIEKASAELQAKQDHDRARAEEAREQKQIEDARPVRADRARGVLSYITGSKLALFNGMINIESDNDPDSDLVAFRLSFNVAKVSPMVEVFRALEIKVP